MTGPGAAPREPAAGSPAPAAPPLLEISDLQVHYRAPRQAGLRAGVVRAVDGVTLSVARGVTLGLVGESGSGKTTLAKSLVKLEPVTSGEIRFGGTEIGGLADRAFLPMRRRIQMVFQDSLNSLNPRYTVVRTLREPFVVHSLAARGELREKVAELMLRVGLSPELMDEPAVQLSGGQRQRVNIARALAPGPELIIADEPTSALDVSVQAQILNLLLALQREVGMSYLFISHDLGVVKHISDRVVIMYLGRVVESAPTEDVFASPNHPYTQALLAEAPKLEVGKKTYVAIRGEIPSPLNPPPGCHFHPRCPYAMPRCREEQPALKEIAPLRFSACHLNDMK